MLLFPGFLLRCRVLALALLSGVIVLFMSRAPWRGRGCVPRAGTVAVRSTAVSPSPRSRSGTRASPVHRAGPRESCPAPCCVSADGAVEGGQRSGGGILWRGNGSERAGGGETAERGEEISSAGASCAIALLTDPPKSRLLVLAAVVQVFLQRWPGG